jgi:Domain of unknown function (DUF6265)
MRAGLTAAIVMLAHALMLAQDNQLAWLAGCWQITRGDEVIDEQWMAPRGGVMLGMSRSVSGGRTTATEFTTLRIVEGRVVYEANPSGQKPTAFPATSLSPDRAVFENPAHDYPRRIIYERQGDALLATIDDGSGGKKVEYPFQRVTCQR